MKGSGEVWWERGSRLRRSQVSAELWPFSALLKVTELTLRSDNINGIVHVTVSSFVFSSFFASEACDAWLRRACRLCSQGPSLR